MDEEKERKMALVLLAAGESRRYGGIKLLDEIDGKKLYLYGLELVRQLKVEKKVVVTRYEEIRKKAEKWGREAVWNEETQLGISHSLQLGLRRVLEELPEIDGVLFLVCDQPYLTTDTVEKMLTAFSKGEKEILCPVSVGKGQEALGNPCIIGKSYFEELFSLEGDVGGKRVIRRHLEEVQSFYIREERELEDIDTKKLR